MVDLLVLAGLTVSSIPIFGFLVSAIFLFRSIKFHAFLMALWGIGLVTAISAFFNEFYCWQDKSFGTSPASITLVFVLESGQGVLYLMVAFEFYTSTLTMETLLLKKRESLPKRKKIAIFLAVTGIYVLLQSALCLIQGHINMASSDPELFIQYDTVPMIGLTFIGIFSTVLLILTVQKLAVLGQNFSCLKSQKVPVRLSLTLFILTNICLVVCLSI